MQTLDAMARRIESGEYLLVAGDEQLLRALPRGNWIGGTIPYFLHDTGLCSRKELYAIAPPGNPRQVGIGRYTESQLSNIPDATPDDGYSLLVLPAGSDSHRRYAREAPEYPDVYAKAIVGWISGIHLDDLGKQQAKVVDGRSTEVLTDGALALHVALPSDKLASVRIANPFQQGKGDVICFEEEGFETTACLVNGRQRRMADYLKDIGADTRWPLVSDYMGTMVNVAFQSIDPQSGRITFYAPVFRGVAYRLAEPPQNRCDLGLQNAEPSGFTCSCILNYLYGELEGAPLPGARGPVTFGEIAHQLLTQTSVFLNIIDRA